MLENTGQKTN